MTTMVSSGSSSWPNLPSSAGLPISPTSSPHLGTSPNCDARSSSPGPSSRNFGSTGLTPPASPGKSPRKGIKSTLSSLYSGSSTSSLASSPSLLSLPFAHGPASREEGMSASDTDPRPSFTLSLAPDDLALSYSLSPSSPLRPQHQSPKHRSPRQLARSGSGAAAGNRVSRIIKSAWSGSPSPSSSPDLVSLTASGNQSVSGLVTADLEGSGAGRHTPSSASASSIVDKTSSRTTPALDDRSASASGEEISSSDHAATAFQWDECRPRGRTETQRFARQRHGHDFKPIPSIRHVDPNWMSYSTAALDWDALATSSLFADDKPGTTAFASRATEPKAEVPHRVLDIGGGRAAQWSRDMARVEGWDSVHFVSLDIAPCIGLADEEPRIKYVQHDILGSPLPFEDQAFDFVRMSNVGLTVPETSWAELIEEALRVLVPGSPIEIVESNFDLLRPRLECLQSVEAGGVHGAASPYPFELVSGLFESALQRRFINPHSTGIIPAQLTLFASKTKTTQSSRMEISARRSNSKPATEPDREHKDDSHVLLAAHAARFGSCSTRIAAEAAVVGAVASGRARTDLLQLELQESLDQWREEMTEWAGLAEMVRDRWDWTCAFDSRVARTLEHDVLPSYEARLASLEHARTGEAIDDIELAEQDMRRQQVLLSKREAETELKNARRRLDGPCRVQDVTLGTLESATFVAFAI